MRKLYNKKIHDLISVTLISICLLLFSTCLDLQYDTIVLNTILVIIFLLFINECLFYCFVNFRLIAILFLSTITLFLLAKPLILLVSGAIWSYFGGHIAFQYLLIMFSTILGIIVGKYILNINMSDISIKGKTYFNNIKINSPLKNIDLKYPINGLFYISFACYLIVKILEFKNMAGKTYLDFYLGKSLENIPTGLLFLSNLSFYFMCFYIAYNKEIKKILLVLIIYVLSTIPTLLIGQRNPFILSILFFIAIIYLKNKYQWKIKVSKKVTIPLLLIASIMSVVSLTVISDLRQNERHEYSLGEITYKFVIQQGGIYDTLCEGIERKDALRNLENNHYTFSAVVDYFKYGKIGNILFGTEPLPPGNNADRALLSNDSAHKLSYLAIEDTYLKGGGIGSTYVLDAFLDLSILGVFLINCFYGLYCNLLESKFGKNLIIDVIFIYSLNKLFFIGRDNALIPFSQLITFHFALVLILIYLIGYVSHYIRKNI